VASIGPLLLLQININIRFYLPLSKILDFDEIFLTKSAFLTNRNKIFGDKIFCGLFVIRLYNNNIVLVCVY